MDKRTMGWAFVIFITSYSIFTATQYTHIAEKMAGMVWYKAIFLSMIMDLSYLIIVIGTIYFSRQKGIHFFKSLLISVLLIFCLDIVNTPKCVYTDDLASGCGENNVMTFTNPDYYFLKEMTTNGISYKASFVIYYMVLPSLLILLIVQLAGWVALQNRLDGMVR